MRGLRSIATGGMSAEVNTRPKRVSEEWVVPPGLESFFPLSPALKRWAKLGRPRGLDSPTETRAIQQRDTKPRLFST